MHPLLSERTPEQVALLDTIYEGRVRLGLPNYRLGVQDASERPLWPTFQYVERTLHRRHGLVATEVMATCPVVRGPSGAYGWIRPMQPSGIALEDAHTDSLTIAGMSHIAAAQEDVQLFLDALNVMVVNEDSFEPMPEEARKVALTSEALRMILQAERKWDLGGRGLQVLRDLLSGEPATWHSRFEGEGAEEKLTLARFLRDYGGVSTAEEYVERVVDVFTPPQPEREPLHPSSLSLPEAIDYLNAVWRARVGGPLIKIGRAEVASKLALECATVDEFESRLSALSSVLDGMAVPDAEKGGKLVELREYLVSELSEESTQRVTDAIDDLRAVNALRVWRQHKGTDERAAKAATRLGLVLPADDWGEAWRHVQARSVSGLSALREEIELLQV
jgi:hypothetical protein